MHPGPVLQGAVWSRAEHGALLEQGLQPAADFFFSGVRQAGEDLASVHFSLLTLWQPLNEQTTRQQIWSSPRLRWPDLGC